MAGGSFGGLTKYDFDTQEWVYIEEIGAVNQIYSLICDVAEGVWIGFTWNGLGYYDEEEGLIEYNEDNSGLADNCCRGLLYDGENNLWVANNHGVSIFDVDADLWQNLRLDNSGISSQFPQCFAYNPSTEDMIVGNFGLLGYSVFNTIYTSIDNSDDNSTGDDISAFYCYPNPVNDYLHLQTSFSIESEYDWFVSNSNGKIVKKGKCDGDENMIKIDELPVGLYVVRIVYQKQEFERKFIKIF